MLLDFEGCTSHRSSQENSVLLLSQKLSPWHFIYFDVTLLIHIVELWYFKISQI